MVLGFRRRRISGELLGKIEAAKQKAFEREITKDAVKTDKELRSLDRKMRDDQLRTGLTLQKRRQKFIRKNILNL